jgi:hypothetical protein
LLLVIASDITPLPDPEKHPNGWCLAVIRIWEEAYIDREEGGIWKGHRVSKFAIISSNLFG